MEFALLRGLSEEEVQQVLATARKRRFAKREVIWHEGDRAEVIHLITSGRIGIRAMTSLGDVVTVAVLGPGEAVGAIGALATDPYFTTTGLSIEPTETMAVRVDSFVDIMRRYPSVTEAVVRFLADRALDLTGQLVDALYVSADARVMMRLTTLGHAYDRGDGSIVIPLTQEDLAELAGVTRPTVNRVLKREESRGTIRLSRGAITITDFPGLTGRLKKG